MIYIIKSINLARKSIQDPEIYLCFKSLWKDAGQWNSHLWIVLNLYSFIYLSISIFPAFLRGSLAGHQAEKLKLSYKASNKLEGIYNSFRGAEV